MSNLYPHTVYLDRIPKDDDIIEDEDEEEEDD